MRFLVYIFSIFLLLPNQTERYYIIKIKGEITNVQTGKILAQGDEIQSNDHLKFSDADAMATVVSDNKNKYSLSLDNNMYNNEILMSYVKNALKLIKTKRVATRSIITNAPIADLKTFLGDNEFTVIGSSLRVRLSKQRFENQSVEVKFDLAGKQINKELIVGDTVLSISRKDLGAKSAGEVKLYHVDFYQRDKSRESIEKITRLDLNFIDEPPLRDELKTIMGVYKKKNYTKQEMKAFLMEYFIDFYGNTHEYLLSQYIDKLIEENMK